MQFQFGTWRNSLDQRNLENNVIPFLVGQTTDPHAIIIVNTDRCLRVTKDRVGRNRRKIQLEEFEVFHQQVIGDGNPDLLTFLARADHHRSADRRIVQPCGCAEVLCLIPDLHIFGEGTPRHIRVHQINSQHGETIFFAHDREVDLDDRLVGTGVVIDNPRLQMFGVEVFTFDQHVDQLDTLQVTCVHDLSAADTCLIVGIVENRDPDHDFLVAGAQIEGKQRQRLVIIITHVVANDMHFLPGHTTVVRVQYRHIEVVRVLGNTQSVFRRELDCELLIRIKGQSAFDREFGVARIFGHILNLGRQMGLVFIDGNRGHFLVGGPVPYAVIDCQTFQIVRRHPFVEHKPVVIAILLKSTQTAEPGVNRNIRHFHVGDMRNLIGRCIGQQIHRAELDYQATTFHVIDEMVEDLRLTRLDQVDIPFVKCFRRTFTGNFLNRTHDVIDGLGFEDIFARVGGKSACFGLTGEFDAYQIQRIGNHVLAGIFQIQWLPGGRVDITGKSVPHCLSDIDVRSVAIRRIHDVVRAQNAIGHIRVPQIFVQGLQEDRDILDSLGIHFSQRIFRNILNEYQAIVNGIRTEYRNRDIADLEGDLITCPILERTRGTRIPREAAQASGC